MSGRFRFPRLLWALAALAASSTFAADPPPPAEFETGSGIQLQDVSAQQLDALVLTAKVWGFLKYHHPTVTAGKQQWDYALLRQLPAILAASDVEQTRKILIAWIDSLGPVAACRPCVELDAQVAVRPRLRWLQDSQLLGTGLQRRLRAIHVNRVADRQYYVSMQPNVGNPVFENEPAYADVKFPDAGFQILAVLRFWNMIEYWAPYRDLIDENWDAVLRDSLARAAKASDKPAYLLELAALVARVDDGHATAGIGPARPPDGDCLLPVNLRYVAGQFVVKSASSEAGARLFSAGDVLTAIDGKRVGEIVARVRRFYSASNDAAFMREMAYWVSRGPCVETKVSVRREGTLEVSAKREPIEPPKLIEGRRNDRAGETLQMLTPKVAYLKASTLKQADVAKYIGNIASADALVVDIRNYPAEYVIYALGSLLVDRPTPFAQFTIPMLSNPGGFFWGAKVSLEPAQPHFAGRVAILVDESSQSQAEYLAMALRASPRAIVVGTTTAGADGNVSPIVLPGGVRTGISGIGVFYPDRTPTQQRGVAIDVPCKLTIAGMRAGRDEILDCALRALESVPK